MALTLLTKGAIRRHSSLCSGGFFGEENMNDALKPYAPIIDLFLCGKLKRLQSLPASRGCEAVVASAARSSS
jgi:hypothetical protein